jgi:hypothetical protein
VQEAVLRGRAANPRPARGGRGGRGGRGFGNRNVSSVQVGEQVSVSAISLPTATSGNNTAQAGDAFERRTRQHTDGLSVHWDDSRNSTNGSHTSSSRSQDGPGTRNIAAATAVVALDMELIATGFEGRLEMDNHADTHAFGKNCLVLYETGQTCSVTCSPNTMMP